MYNHNRAQQSKNRVHISWDILDVMGDFCSNSKYSKIMMTWSSELNMFYEQYIIICPYCVLHSVWLGGAISTVHLLSTVYPKKYAHGFVVLCFVVVMQLFIMNSHEVFIHIHQGCFAGTGAIVRLPQCQWSKPDGYGKISQCITTTKHSKAKTMCIFLGIYCTYFCIPNCSFRPSNCCRYILWKDK